LFDKVIDGSLASQLPGCSVVKRFAVHVECPDTPG
jgi:hypothetical protein